MLAILKKKFFKYICFQNDEIIDHKDMVVCQSTDNFKSADKIELPQATKLNVSPFDFQNLLQR